MLIGKRIKQNLLGPSQEGISARNSAHYKFCIAYVPSLLFQSFWRMDGRIQEKGRTKPTDGKEAVYSFELVLDQSPQSNGNQLI